MIKLLKSIFIILAILCICIFVITVGYRFIITPNTEQNYEPNKSQYNEIAIDNYSEFYYLKSKTDSKNMSLIMESQLESNGTKVLISKNNIEDYFKKHNRGKTLIFNYESLNGNVYIENLYENNMSYNYVFIISLQIDNYFISFQTFGNLIDKEYNSIDKLQDKMISDAQKQTQYVYHEYQQKKDIINDLIEM